MADLRTYARFVLGLRDYLHHTVTVEEARATVRQRLAEREDNFLRLVERGIFGYPRSPYLPLLRLAQVELGDIRNMVRDVGLEGTLHALRQAGVYLTFEEFKGREPVVRDGKVLPVNARDLYNPYLQRYYYAQTGGSTGAGTRVPHDLDHLAAQVPFMVLARDAHGVLNVPTALWRGVLPDASGLNHTLWSARLGQVPEKWFSQIAFENLQRSLGCRITTYGAVLAGRLFGAPIPWPEMVDLDRAVVIARWAAGTAKAHGACLVLTQVSRALRVSIAAQEAGLDLTGTTFALGGEPPTPAKVEGIVKSGARCFPHYIFTEAGLAGVGCSHPDGCNDLHLLSDALALIQLPRRVPNLDIEVPAFSFTSLLATAPRLLLNVEIDDYGIVEQRSCGCPLEACGYGVHLRDVWSFRKLTGEGVTLVGSEMMRILEEVLPNRFGGSPMDYQLLEEEDEGGFTRLNLLVSPRIEIDDDTAVIEVVLHALGQAGVGGDLARLTWDQAGTLQVRRQEPIWTARGKFMPLHLAKHTGRLE